MNRAEQLQFVSNLVFTKLAEMVLPPDSGGDLLERTRVAGDICRRAQRTLLEYQWRALSGPAHPGDSYDKAVVAALLEASIGMSCADCLLVTREATGRCYAMMAVFDELEVSLARHS